MVKLKEILNIPTFQNLFEKSLKSIESQGTKAAHIHRATTLSQALSEKLFTNAMSGSIEAKDAIKLLEILLKSATLLDGKDPSPVSVQTNVGVSLSLPYGLNNPKIRHISPPPSMEPMALDVGV